MQLVFVDAGGDQGVITDEFVVGYDGHWEAEIIDYVDRMEDELAASRRHHAATTDDSEPPPARALQELSVRLFTEFPITAIDIDRSGTPRHADNGHRLVKQR